MRSALLYVLCVALAGCAGSHMGIQGDPAAKEVTIAGVSYVVSPLGAGYAATHRDYLANNLVVAPSDYLARKAGFIAAIEAVSGCKVVDTVHTPGADTLQARVKC